MSRAARAARALTAELVAIDSVNPGLVDGAAGEAKIVEFLRSRLEENGFTTHVVRAGDDRPSLVAVPSQPREGRSTVVLNGHLDTVGVAAMPAPFTPRVEDGRLFGRGSADMKAGIAAMVTAAEELVAGGSSTYPVLALVADEEDASVGSEAVIAALPALGITPDVCLIAEPTDLGLARSLRGFGVARVRFRGRAAHSSQAHLGINAITHLGRFLYAVDSRAPALRADGGDLMVTVASGGTSPFVVPDAAECYVEMRTPPDVPGSSIVSEVGGLVAPEWDAVVELIAARDGWRIDAGGPAASLAERLGRRLGTGTTFDAPYWMEAPLWQAVCPAVICGPSGGGLHAADEWVDLDQVDAFTDALIEVLSVHRG